MKRLGNETGQTLLIASFSLSILLGFAAFATDMGVLLYQRRELQTVADSAAIAAATEALNEGNPAKLSTGEWDAAYNDAVDNGFTPGSASSVANSTTGATLTIVLSPNIGPFNSTGYVEAIATQSSNNIFMSLFGAGTTPVSTFAIASDVITSNGCLYVQNPGLAASPAVDMGGNSLIAAGKCGVSINGNLDMTGNSTMDAGFVAVTGSITGNDPSSSYAQGVPPQQPPPFLTNLNYNPVTASGGSCSAPAAPSGTTCYYDYNGGVLTGTLNPGIYYFDEPGGPTIQGPISGTGGVMIYLAGNIPFDFDSVGTMNLTASTSGTPATNPYYNVLIDAPTDGSASGSGTYTCSHGKGNNSGNPGELYFDFGSGTTTLNGIIYAPGMQMFTQDQGATLSINTDLVIGNICMQSATMTINTLEDDSPVYKVGLVF